jgi:hypothetical protein
MKNLPELHRMALRVDSEYISVQAIICGTPKNIEILEYDHSLAVKMSISIDETTFSKLLFALIYEPSIDDSLGMGFSKLEQLLVNEKEEYCLGIYHEPVSNYSNVYLMAHSNDINGLGSCFKGSKLGIFQCRYEDFLGYVNHNYINYIQSYLSSKNQVGQELVTLKNTRKSISEDIDRLNTNISDLCKKNDRIKKKLETAKKMILKISKKQLNITNNNLDCMLCSNSVKSVMLLPCGDLVVCKDCLIHSMQLPLNVELKNCKIKCPKCFLSINQAREVFY